MKMIIRSIRVQNFRCIKDETLPCEKLTTLVGPNGSGKSSFLRALSMFYTPTARYTEDDFYDQDTTHPISVTVSFSDLTSEEKRLFKKYVENETITVEKIMEWPSTKSNQKYHGTSLQNPDFSKFRAATGGDMKREYNELCNTKYPDLPKYTNKYEAKNTLQKWEETHSDKCQRKRDDGQFFGFKEVGEAHLERFTRFIFIPAVRDAAEDAAEGRGTPLTEIMDLVVRNTLSQRSEIVELQENTQKQYDKLVDPAKLQELQTLEQSLSNTLKTYVPDSGVEITWSAGETIFIPMPQANIKLIEDDYLSSVERTGHGLQRAFILTMLQHLAVAQSPSSQTDEEPNGNDETPHELELKIPNLIIAIEEPELYQHPNRQRHLSKIFLRLTSGEIKGVAACTQVIYSTHSPLFVDIKRFNTVRRLRKILIESNKPKQTKVYYTTFDNVAKTIWEADGAQGEIYTGATLEPRLQSLMTPWMNEGFFADLAVLVEGPEDRAAILGIATALGHDFESIGISVIPCMGKRNLDRPIAIFTGLQIPVYAIWDSDYGKPGAKAEDNHRLLQLFKQTIEDWPETVTEHFACFNRTLTTKLTEEISEEICNCAVEECCKRLCLDKKYANKNPLVIREIIELAKKKQKSSETLEKIISQIITKRQTKSK